MVTKSQSVRFPASIQMYVRSVQKLLSILSIRLWKLCESLLWLSALSFDSWERTARRINSMLPSKLELEFPSESSSAWSSSPLSSSSAPSPASSLPSSSPSQSSPSQSLPSPSPPSLTLSSSFSSVSSAPPPSSSPLPP